VTTGTFDADSVLDLVTANSGTNNVSILLGDGTGGFGAATNFGLNGGTSPRDVAVGLFNADGNADLVVVNNGTNNVSILLGTGTGSFGTATNVTVGTGPSGVAVGDYSGDGKIDLAVVNSGGNDVTILVGNGSGGFAPAAGSPVAVGSGPVGIVAANLTADTQLDLAVANVTTNNVTILLNNGSGGFSPAVGSPVSVGAGARRITVGTFNAGTAVDLAVSNSGSTNVSILLGDGTGGFGAPANVTVGTSPYGLTVADFNADSTSDIAVANSGSANVSILQGTGTGTFAATNFGVGVGPVAVAAGDFNADGWPDFAAANSSLGDVSVRLNTTVSLVLSITIPTGPVFLGSAASGAQFSAQLGTITVTDNRTSGTHVWTTTVTATNFTTGGGSVAETVDTSNLSYWSGPRTGGTGLGTFVPGQPTAANAVTLASSRTAFTHSGTPSVNVARWNPTIVVTIPAAAVSGTYTGTIVHSVA
jgi:hypothetical protein